MKSTRILLDMDQILVDFIGGAIQIHGISRQKLESCWPAGQYSIIEPMGLTQDEFWRPINEAGDLFWLGLETLPWINDLLHLVDSLTDDWYIVSTPSLHHTSYSGKARWLKRFFGQSFNRFIFTFHKGVLACSNALLIDDCEETVEQFIIAGGSALVFPGRTNKLYNHADSPVDYLSKHHRLDSLIFQGAK